MTDHPTPFDPTRHITNVSGKAYLPIKARLQWLRHDHPDAWIETEHIIIDEGFAVFRAVIKLPDGPVVNSYGSETRSDFGDFIEKAETKAIGRACNLLGYGIEYADDLGDTPPANAPRQPARQQEPARFDQRPSNQSRQSAPPSGGGPPFPDATSKVTERQAKMLYMKCRDAGVDSREFSRTYGPTERTDDLPGGQPNVEWFIAQIENQWPDRSRAQGGQTGSMQAGPNDYPPIDDYRDF